MKSRKMPAIVALLIMTGAIAACTTVDDVDVGSMTFASEPLLGKVVWHDLITEDIDSARTFYSGMFGWTFEDSAGARGETYSLARAGDVYVAGLVGIAPATDGENYSRWLPYVSVADVDDAVSRATSSGATIAATARKVSLGRVAAIVDPEGAVIGLVRSNLGDPDDRTTSAAPGRPVWTELISNDVATSGRFYSELFGYDVRKIDRRGGEFTLLEADGIDRAGILDNPTDEYSPVWLTFFGVNDPAAAARKAASLGGEVILDASADLRDGTVAVVTDPAGAVLVLQKWSVPGGDG